MNRFVCDSNHAIKAAGKLVALIVFMLVPRFLIEVSQLTKTSGDQSLLQVQAVYLPDGDGKS
jgi:hypothetical protein